MTADFMASDLRKRDPRRLEQHVSGRAEYSDYFSFRHDA